VEIIFAFASLMNLALDAIRYKNGSSAINSKPKKEYV
jgi:hypothetical protein